jgi:hypothetical protein
MTSMAGKKVGSGHLHSRLISPSVYMVYMDRPCLIQSMRHSALISCLEYVEWQRGMERAQRAREKGNERGIKGGRKGASEEAREGGRE